MFPVKAWCSLQMKPMRGAPSTAWSRELHAVGSDKAPADSLQLPARKRKGTARLSNEAGAV